MNGHRIRRLFGLLSGKVTSHSSIVFALLTEADSGMYTFTFAYGVSFGPIGWVLPSEVFPISMRGKGIALSTATNWFNNCECLCSFFNSQLTYVVFHQVLIGLITPVLVEMSPSLTFIIFAIPCSLAYFWATYQVPETANVSLEEIDAVFNSSAGRDDAILKRQVSSSLIFVCVCVGPSHIEFRLNEIWVCMI